MPPPAIRRASRACGRCGHELDAGALQTTPPRARDCIWSMVKDSSMAAVRVTALRKE
ncbi:hypothetical protein HMPREF1979_00498 [Actinomyces johnsonii F0542]|uniref:Uncharacterized protein n=1 Tax=Actinomyces johnsonii F0542 TaxID=1321818 RepID=U1S460_9ACTO|nr:hypothetical protein HMPREF1979_00498 [Actinomyces johnsonii F0542]